MTEKSKAGSGVDQERSTARTTDPHLGQLFDSSTTVERDPTRFIRTPSETWCWPTANALYVAHSIPSRRNTVDGVTLREIIADQRRQAEADDRTPLLVSEITEALIVAIAIGLVKAIPGEAL